NSPVAYIRPYVHTPPQEVDDDGRQGEDDDYPAAGAAAPRESAGQPRGARPQHHHRRTPHGLPQNTDQAGGFPMRETLIATLAPPADEAASLGSDSSQRPPRRIRVPGMGSLLLRGKTWWACYYVNG